MPGELLQPVELLGRQERLDTLVRGRVQLLQFGAHLLAKLILFFHIGLLLEVANLLRNALAGRDTIDVHAPQCVPLLRGEFDFDVHVGLEQFAHQLRR
jgi:hypothetical protein